MTKYEIYVDGEKSLVTDNEGYYKSRLVELRATFGRDRVSSVITHTKNVVEKYLYNSIGPVTE